MQKYYGLVLCVLLWANLTAASAVGQVTAFHFDEVNRGQITVDFVGQLTGVQILLELSEGTIVLGPEVFPVPGSEDTTFIATGNVPVTISTVPTIVGGAVDIGGLPEFSATPTRFDVAAFIFPGQRNASNQDQTGFVIGNIVVSDDAVSQRFRVFAAADGYLSTAEFFIPEPSTLILLGLAGLGLASRRGISPARSGLISHG